MDKAKVLYVEDEPFLAKIVLETLEGQGYKVLHVDHGDKVITAYKNFKPHVCILDVMLPGKDGFQIGKDIRRFDASIPILFLTAKSQTQDLVEGFQSGGNDYIKKPFSMEELMIRMENLLSLTRRQSAHKSAELSWGDCTLFSEQLLLKTPKRDIQLSHRENEILKLLFDPRGLNVERRQILMDVWGDDSFFNSRNLDVYIRKIRQYLTDDPTLSLITLKGVGYRMVRVE